MLTDVALKALKPGAKPYKRADEGGLYILIQPNGKKIWRLTYRFAGEQKLLSGGAYPGWVAGFRTHTISENRMLDVMYRSGWGAKRSFTGFAALPAPC